MIETCFASVMELMDKKDKEILEVGYMVKSTQEWQMVAKNNLKFRTK